MSMTPFTITHDRDWTWIAFPGWEPRSTNPTTIARQEAILTHIKDKLGARFARNRKQWYVKRALFEAEVQAAIDKAEQSVAPVSPINENAFNYIPASLNVPRLYAQDGKGEEAIVYVKLFTPDSSWTWYITEYDPAEEEAFGFAYNAGHPDGAELGYISLKELKEVRGLMGLPIERDVWFKPQPLAQVKARLFPTPRDGYTTEPSDTPPPDPIPVLMPDPGHIEAALEHIREGMYQVHMAEGFRVKTPVLVLDEDDYTIIAMQLLGSPEAVKANWAALVGGGKVHRLNGSTVKLGGMKNHILLKATLPCGWVEWWLIHRQASHEVVDPACGFFYLLKEAETEMAVLRQHFFKMLDHTTPLPMLPEWTTFLWQAGRVNNLITLIDPTDCYGRYAWKVQLDSDTWQAIISQGLQSGRITF